MTIKDVAEYSGVSVSTVSRVLNDHPDVSAAVRQRVMAAVRELHYVPNSSARDLVKSQSAAIGVVVRGVENPFFAGIIRAIEEAVNAAGYTMVLHQIRSGEDELKAGAALVRSKRLLGLILLGGCFDYTPEQTAALEVPFVCCTYTNSFGKLAETAYSSVTIDDRKEALRAVQLLLERGHRKIAMVLDSIHDHSISELRYMGYCQALENAGLTVDPALVVETGTFDMEAAYMGMQALLRRRQDLTAVFVEADSVAVAVMKALYDAGKRVPEDCSVVAIDGIEMSNYFIPTLTTMVQPREEMGRKAVRILLDILEGKAENCHLQVEASLRMGGSVRALEE